jgi:hypothetical protein
VFPIFVLGAIPMVWLFLGSFYFLLGISASAVYAWALLIKIITATDQRRSKRRQRTAPLCGLEFQSLGWYLCSDLLMGTLILMPSQTKYIAPRNFTMT